MSIEWGGEHWGQPGHNVHIAENGSHVPDAHSEGVSDQ
jgi:hypothetical protein